MNHIALTSSLEPQQKNRQRAYNNLPGSFIFYISVGKNTVSWLLIRNRLTLK